MKKRLLGILLSFALMLTMMPALGMHQTVYAALPDLYVGTEKVDTSVDCQGEYWSYDVDSNTLTLSGVTITTGYKLNDTEYGIYYNGNATLNTVLESDTVNTIKDIERGIYCKNSGLTIMGAGTLKANGVSAPGIYANKSIDIEGGNISASTGGLSSYAIYSYGKVTITDGNVTTFTTNNASGIHGLGVTINGGEVTASGSSAIESSGDVTISGGTVSASGNYGIYLTHGSTTTISGGVLTASGTIQGLYGNVSLGEDVIAIAGNDKTDAEPTSTITDQKWVQVANAYPLWIGGVQVTSANMSGTGWSYTPATTGENPTPATLKLNGYSYSGEGYNNAAIYAEEDLIIETTGDNNVENTSKEDNTCAIWVTEDLTLQGSGTLNATGLAGIQANQKLMIEGGIIRATGISSGIGGLTVTINKGTIVATATDDSGSGASYGISGGSEVTINGGQVTVSGSTAGIFNSAGIFGIEVTINGGQVTASGSTRGTGSTTGISGTVKNSIAGTGWKDTEGKEGKTVIAIDREGKELTFKKVQFPEVVTVTFDSAGGSDVADQTIEKGTKATKPADPTRSGYTFDGWYLGSTAFDFGNPIEKDITLTAHWKKNDTPVAQSTITYDLNGGTLNGETGKVAVKVNNGTEITLPAPTRDGYTFDYWEGSKYNAGDKYTVNGDHTFKAVWKTADKGGGSDSSDKGGSSSGKKGVNTGDENNLGAWIVLLFAALTGTTGMAFARKRRND